MILQNKKYVVEINEQGALTAMKFVGDRYDSNFILESAEEPWVPENKQWGLGFLSVGNKHLQIEELVALKQTDNRQYAEYMVEFDDDRVACVWNGDREKSRVHRKVRMKVTRELCDDGLYENYELINESEKYIAFDEIGLYSSFHDSYYTGKDVLSKHVSQHICTMEDHCYIAAVRQSGKPSHMGLITLDGAFRSFQTEEQNTSNVRGVIALVAKDVRVGAGESKTYRRVITDFADLDEFETKVCDYTGYPVMDYGVMTVQKGEFFQIRVKNPGKLEKIKINGETLVEKEGCYRYKPEYPGEYEGKVFYGDGKIGLLKFRCIRPIDELLRLRAQFIVKNQQILDKNDPRYGAFMPYDIDREKIYKIEEIETIYHGVPDRNDARERIGMGVFLAEYARVTGDMSVLASLRLYSDFLLRYIVDEKFDTWDCYLRNESKKYYERGLLLAHESVDMTFRTYNYTFAMLFFTEMYLLTKEKNYAGVVAGICKRYVEKTGECNATPATVEMLREAGFADDAEQIAREVEKYTRAIGEKGENYDSGEVSYEQWICATIFGQMCDYYLATKDEKVRGYVEDQRIRCQAFDGNQPHYISNSMPIRHWDGFWFGKYELWGDTMPHYWSLLSANAYFKYYQITGDVTYRERAKKIYRCNLSLIRDDGSAYNCYLVNEKSNGRPAGRYDPLANDQDWAFYHYMKNCESEKI